MSSRDPLKRELASAYDAAAPSFAGDADPLVYALLNRPLADALVPAGGPTLDVAAGSGSLGRLLPDVVSVDLSSGQLASNPAPKVLGDAESLPFRDDAFAAVGCAFGINHFPDALAATKEMARLAPVVGLLTWLRPDPPHAPKQIVFDVLARRFGSARNELGVTLDEIGTAVGSADAVHDLLHRAGLHADAAVVEVEVPWPGVDGWLDYRLGLPTVPLLSDEIRLEIRREVAEAIAALPPTDLEWRPPLILGVGRR